MKQWKEFLLEKCIYGPSDTYVVARSHLYVNVIMSDLDNAFNRLLRIKVPEVSSSSSSATISTKTTVLGSNGGSSHRG